MNEDCFSGIKTCIFEAGDVWESRYGPSGKLGDDLVLREIYSLRAKEVKEFLKE